jgi:hypothetical protein
MRMARAMRTLLGCILATLTLLVHVPTTAFACSCIMPGTPREEYEASAMVFEGRFVDNMGDEEQGNLPFNFEVARVWKGPLAPMLTVYTGQGGGDCGYAFEPGRTYLVYASYWEHEGVFTTSICSRTRPIEEAAADIAAHGAPRQPPEVVAPAPAAAEPRAPTTAATTPAAESQGRVGSVLTALAGAGVGAALHAVWASRRRSRSER